MQRQELLDFAKNELLLKAAILNRDDMSDVKKINDVQELVNKLMFPENYTKTVLPDQEFKDKTDRLSKLSKKFPTNYKKVNDRPRIPSKVRHK
jgi:hypothetical protein